ncbi:hypothetical protein CTAYLR_005518 [Chrysophaeum taylorii]|uniref:Major facilitator superfamily (MFS) profile domain-containing protein n=1 Tax=Chrysophaeum taylorii TaxID=2483200 RepID=A0AAD7XH62_9STRA|nr:hypothetical protein CTAYLR_005518 [Chrysophaeum taylorii]
MEATTPLLGVRPSSAAEDVRRNVLLYMFCGSYVFGTLLAVREDYTAKVLHANDPVAVATYAVAAYYLAHALTAPFLGKLSDGVGRKPIMLLGIAMTTIVHALVALVPRVELFVVLFGLLGLCDSSYTMGYLMLVDTSHRPLSPGIAGWMARHAGVSDAEGGGDDDGSLVERRVGVLFSFCWGFGLLGSCCGVGVAVAITHFFSIRMTVGLAAGLSLFVFVRIATALPETVEPSEKDNLLLLAERAITEQAAGARLLLATPRRRVLLLVNFFQHVVAAGSITILEYWVVFKFGFGIALQALTIVIAILAVAGGVLVLQLGLIPLCALFSDQEPVERAAVLLVAVCLPAWTLLGLATMPWMALCGAVAIGSIAVFPELRALLTADLPKAQQGFVQGALASVNSLSNILGAVAMLAIFEHSADDDTSHDSHRARHSFFANAIWHAIIACEIVVIILLHNAPPRGDDDSASSSSSSSSPLPAKPVTASPLLDDDDTTKFQKH